MNITNFDFDFSGLLVEEDPFTESEEIIPTTTQVEIPENIQQILESIENLITVERPNDRKFIVINFNKNHFGRIKTLLSDSGIVASTKNFNRTGMYIWIT